MDDKRNPEDEFVDENVNNIDDREEATIGMSEINDFDFERAVQLMSVMEKVANVAPKSMAISGLAAAALQEMNEEAKVIAKRRAEAFVELERKRDEAFAAQAAERDAEAQAQAEEDAQVNIHPQPAFAPTVPRAYPAQRPAPPVDTGRRL